VRSASILVVLCVGFASLVGCAATPAGGMAAAPVVTAEPDEFVLRDVRADAAARMRCQAPMVLVRKTTWAGSEGNVVAMGCGFEINYYLRCLTSHQCSITSRD
jgi:hypothetical protein